MASLAVVITRGEAVSLRRGVKAIEPDTDRLLIHTGPPVLLQPGRLHSGVSSPLQQTFAPEGFQGSFAVYASVI